MAPSTSLVMALTSAAATAQYIGLSSILNDIGIASYSSLIINPSALPTAYASSVLAPSASFAPTAVSASSAYPLSSGAAYPTDAPDIVYDAPSSGSPCGSIQSAVDEWSQSSNPQNPFVEASVALECLNSIPFVTDMAADTMEAMDRLIPFQTTLAYLKNPPEGYGGNTVDILAGLQNITRSLSSFDSYYQFELALYTLVSRANDGHFAFQGAATQRLPFIRPFEYSLVSVVPDGSDQPQVFVKADTGPDVTYTPSPVTQIDGQDVLDFLQAEAQNAGFHDPDARYNSLFFDPQEAGASPTAFGGFCVPGANYPGESTSLTFDNGTTVEMANLALVVGADEWRSISDGQDFYDAFIQISSSLGSTKKSRRAALQQAADATPEPSRKTLSRREIPEGYPEPFQTPDFEDDTLFFSGYFLSYGGSPSGLAVLSTPNYLAQEDTDIYKFQRFIESFLSACRERGAQKIIVDMSSNGGGTAMLSFDMFKQFFPAADVSLRYRLHYNQGMNLMGQILTPTNRDRDAYATFDAAHYLTDNGGDFDNWKQMAGPVREKSDQFSSLFQFDLADAEQYLGGLTFPITGEGSSPESPSPFASEDIIVLTNGMCSSACNNFVQLMVQQGNVKTMTLGGRPSNTGSMIAVGGVQGGVALTDSSLGQEARIAYQLSDSSYSSATLLNNLPIPVPNNAILGVNSMNVYRNDSSIPIQFRPQYANCRLYLTPAMASDVTEVWRTVADVAWSDDGDIDYSRCVGGEGQAGDFAVSAGSGGSGGSSGSGGSDGSGGENGAGRASAGNAFAVLVTSAVGVLGLGLL